jgi:quercetin dioxygenase-like cupin family protein
MDAWTDAGRSDPLEPEPPRPFTGSSGHPFILRQADYPEPLCVADEKIIVLAPGERTGRYELFLQQGISGTGPSLHEHPWDETFYVLCGELEFSIGQDSGLTVATATLVHIPAGTPHAFRWREAGSMLSVTSRCSASRLFSELSAELAKVQPDTTKVDAIRRDLGVTITGKD